MSITVDELASLVKQLFNRLEVLEAAVKKAPAAQNSKATPRVKSAELVEFANANPGLIGDDAPQQEGFDATTDVYVYDVSGRTDTYKDVNTGLPCFWVQSKGGSRFLVDGMGVPMFLHNPLREKFYATQ